MILQAQPPFVTFVHFYTNLTALQTFVLYS